MAPDHTLSLARDRGAVGRIGLLLAFGFLCATAAVLSAPAPARADQTTVAWNDVANPHVAGFKIHYGRASRTYDSILDVGDVTSRAVTGLEDGVAYFFAVSSYDVFGQESALSDEAIFAGPGTDGDGDGLPDTIELLGCTSPEDADSDDDGIPDGVEDTSADGQTGPGETNPCAADTDGDGLQDGTELSYTLASIGPDTDPAVFRPDLDPSTATDPLNPDTEDDGLADGAEDTNGNGRVDAGETDPLVADNPLLFADSFDTVALGSDPDWTVVRGRFGVDGNRRYASVRKFNNLSVVVDPNVEEFAAGRIEAEVLLTKRAAKAPNGLIVFHFENGQTYRYVRITPTRIAVGQVGTYAEGDAATQWVRKLRTRVGRWHRVRVDVDANSVVRVYVDGRTNPTLIHAFPSAQTGLVGLAANRALSRFDNVTVWDESVLP